ncbi:hypothetical protein A1351_00745 [Methylosinus sp. R-45379]|nr:hypothetical protein A1351_00745 [Methylosinus sp. R-45379]TDX60920.1 hypothetical protein EDE12_11733 [Methylosinus sp. sav-2]
MYETRSITHLAERFSRRLSFDMKTEDAYFGRSSLEPRIDDSWERRPCEFFWWKIMRPWRPK